MFVLATGERGLGWQAVFGNRRMTAYEFELYSYIQNRVLLAASDDGKATISSEVAARDAIAYDQREKPQAIAIPVFDPETMTPDQIADWVAKYADQV